MARAWIEVPPGTGWGAAASLKTGLGRLGYLLEEYRGEGPVMLSVRAEPGEYAGSPPGPSPWWREPLLERARPGTLLADTVIDVTADAEIELRDRSWVMARVGAEWKDTSGRWCVHLRWTASTVTGGREGVFVYDPEHVRRAG